MPSVTYKIILVPGIECSATYSSDSYFEGCTPVVEGDLTVWDEVKYLASHAFGMRGKPIDPDLCSPIDLDFILGEGWVGKYAVEGMPTEEELEPFQPAETDGHGNQILY